MGLNISGLVVDKNYENNLDQLESLLGEKLIFEREVTFGETLESWKEDTYCDIYFSENGTFILLSMELGGFDFYADDQVAFSFVLSETTMMLTVNYTENGELLRSIMESDEMNEDEGEPFDFEKTEDDRSELIYHLIEKTLGESFDDIDLGATCKRYSFEQIAESVSNEQDTLESSNKDKNPWWKFW